MLISFLTLKKSTQYFLLEIHTMGNCVSQTGQREFLKNFQNVAGRGETRVGGAFMNDDPEAFQVFVKKRNKFIPGNDVIHSIISSILGVFSVAYFFQKDAQ